MNKTPIHTAKTKELLFLSNQNEKIKNLLKESQIWFAKKTVELHIALDCKMWLVGYAEVKNKGLFEDYKKILLEEYQKSEIGKNAFKKFFVYQHFSMNRFLIDLNEFSENYPQPLSEEITISESATAKPPAETSCIAVIFLSESSSNKFKIVFALATSSSILILGATPFSKS